MYPDDRQQPPSWPTTTAQYRSPGIVVTSHHLLVGTYRYEIADLSDLRHARGAPHPGAMVGLVIAVAEAMLLAPLVGVVHTPLAVVLAVVALFIPCAVGLVCARRWPRQNELLARYRGREVVLFANRDETDFGRAARAIQRAVEDRAVEDQDRW